MDKLMLTIPEAAALVGISRSKAYTLISSGEWCVVRIGRCARVPADWLQQWVQSLAAQAEAEIAAEREGPTA